jgi:hypothetical protein
MLPNARDLRKITFEPNTGCWLWMGAKGRGGYGNTKRGGRYVNVHRYIAALYKGPIPPGLVVMHLCHIRLCCNPDHLKYATLLENNNDPYTRAATSKSMMGNDNAWRNG